MVVRRRLLPLALALGLLARGLAGLARARDLRVVDVEVVVCGAARVGGPRGRRARRAAKAEPGAAGAQESAAMRSMNSRCAGGWKRCFIFAAMRYSLMEMDSSFGSSIRLAGVAWSVVRMLQVEQR